LTARGPSWPNDSSRDENGDPVPQVEMTRARRRLSITVAGLVGVVCMLGATAYACSITHNGQGWFCPTSAPCGPTTPQGNLPRGAVRYSQARQLYPVDHHFLLLYAPASGACMSGTHFQRSDGSGDAVMTPTAKATWKGKGVVLPSTPGTYEECGLDLDDTTG